MTGSAEHVSGTEIAIVGLACRFPGAATAQEFWRNLRAGADSISHFAVAELVAAGVPKSLASHASYVRSQGVLDDYDLFDAEFFGINASDARLLDPQHRVLLECAWSALEDSGYASSRPRNTGIYVGSYYNTYLELIRSAGFCQNPTDTFVANIANEKDYLATRLSYHFDLTGPSLTVQTACSTSLVAVHLAAQALLGGDCDMALAGGVTCRARQRIGYPFQEGGIFAPDGKTRAFDAAARGTVPSNGVGIVVLKRLADALAARDNIYAIIKGSAVGNDGAHRVGFTAPSVSGQAAIIEAACNVAQVEPRTIQYVEAHGSGTALGDPIEVRALSNVFRASSRDKAWCHIGSVKTNIGHTAAAAGVAGLIKTALALRHGAIPPSLNFESANPEIDFDASPFSVVTGCREWRRTDSPRRAGVSSFGMGGTGAHLVLEEAPARDSAGRRSLCSLVPLSAKSPEALSAARANLAAHLEMDPLLEIADVGYTLRTGRRVWRHRAAVVADCAQDAIRALSQQIVGSSLGDSLDDSELPVAFLIPGLGDHRPEMGRELNEALPLFRNHLDDCCRLFREHLDTDLKSVLYAAGDVSPPKSEGIDLRRMFRQALPGNGNEAGPLSSTRLAQPAMFAVTYSLARSWEEIGIAPNAIVGYSLGEYVAACLAGVFSLEEAVWVVAERARLIDALPRGAMLAVPLAVSVLQPYLSSALDIAAVNAPNLSVVAGPVDAVASLQLTLHENNVLSQPLSTTHAFHSRMLAPAAEPLTRIVEQIRLRAPQRRYLSNVTGDWADETLVRDPGYWARHMCATVRYSECIGRIWEQPRQLLIECGPGQSLGSLAVQLRPSRSDGHQSVLSSMPSPYDASSEFRHFLDAVGRAWTAGVNIDLSAFDTAGRRRVSLPTYPFARMRHWVEPGGDQLGDALERQEDRSRWFWAPSWEPIPRQQLPTEDQSGARRERWLFLADESGIALRMARVLRDAGHRVDMAFAGRRPSEENAEDFHLIDPNEPEEYRKLLAELKRQARLPDRLVHMWTVKRNCSDPLTEATFEHAQALGLRSLVYASRAIAEHIPTAPLALTVVTHALCSVNGERIGQPAFATVQGAVAVFPHEHPNVQARCIDIDLDDFNDVLPQAGAPPRPGAMEILLAEILGEVRGDLIAHRGRRIWRRRMLETPVREVASIPFREHGVYLITGGLGGIGLTLARHLARTAHARLVLVSRTVLPADADARQHCHGSAEDGEMMPRLDALREIRHLGADVLHITADVACADAMKRAVAEAQKRFGVLNGVLHCAAVPGGGLMQLKSGRDMDAVLRAKCLGAIALCEVVAGLQLDFLVLFSSVLAISGAAGQVDYCAANCFVDCLAHQQAEATSTRVISINWDAWRDAGMARKAVGRAESPGRRCVSGRLNLHWLGDAPDGGAIYQSDLSVRSSWLIDEHRMANHAVVPGTGHLELVRAAFCDLRTRAYGADVSSTGVEIYDVNFLLPVVVAEDETKAVRIVLHPVPPERDRGGRYNFQVLARGRHAHGSPWTLHVTGSVAGFALQPTARLDSGAMIEAAGMSDLGRPVHMGPMSFGPRSQCLRRIFASKNEALAEIELPSEFADELGDLQLHPALMDISAAFVGLHLAKRFRIPLRYERIRIRAPLTSRIFSRHRLREPDDGGETTISDFSIFDVDGRELVHVEGFLVKRIDDVDARMVALRDGGLDRNATLEFPEVSDVPGDAIGLGRHLQLGLSSAEGSDALERILAWDLGPQVAVSTTGAGFAVPATPSTPAIRRPSGRKPTALLPKRIRSEVLSDYAAPRDELEQRLAGIWRDLLGVEQVGINDNFFELGGHSLLGLALVARLRETLAVEVTLSSFFRALTIAQQAELIRSKGEMS
jgi:acyl transferase domain-containing protein